MPLLLIPYIALGWWAANRTVYANKILFGTSGAIFTRKFTVALFLGWILIPIAIIGAIIKK